MPRKSTGFCTRYYFSNAYSMLNTPMVFFTLLLVLLLIWPTKTPAAVQDRCPNNDNVFCEVLVPQQVTTRGLNNAIQRAHANFSANQDQVYIINLPGGRYNILPDPLQPVNEQRGLIRTNGFKFRNQGSQTFRTHRLIIRGQGMYKTTLVFPVENTNISGSNASRIRWEHLHFTKDRLKTTQGQIKEVNSDHLVVELELGFPNLRPYEKGGIFNNGLDHGRKIRKYVNPIDGPPEYVRLDNAIPGGYKWTYARKKFPGAPRNRLWKVYFHNDHIPHITKFNVDDLVGIKSKHGGQAYKFVNSFDIAFDHVMWTHEARGVFKGAHYIQITNSTAGPDPWIDNHFSNVWPDGIRRTGVEQYLATSSGGPQIGSPPDNPINWLQLSADKRSAAVTAEHGGSNHVVENNQFIRLGDDPIGLFNVEKNVVVKNNRVVDGPARALLDFNVCDFFGHVTVAGNDFRNSEKKELGYYDRALEGSWKPADLVPWCRAWWQKIHR